MGEPLIPGPTIIGAGIPVLGPNPYAGLQPGPSYQQLTPVTPPPPGQGGGPPNLPPNKQTHGQARSKRMRRPYGFSNDEGVGMETPHVIRIDPTGTTESVFPANGYVLKTDWPVLLLPLSSVASENTVTAPLVAVPSYRMCRKSPAATGALGSDLGAIRSRGGRLYLPYGGTWYIEFLSTQTAPCYLSVMDARDPSLIATAFSEYGEHRVVTSNVDTALVAAAAPTTLAAANRHRYLCLITNTGTGDLRLGIGFVPAATTGILLKANGGNMTLNGPALLTGQISAMAPIAATAVSLQEWI